MREMADALLDSLDGQFVAGIAESRELPVDTVRQVDRGGPRRPGRDDEGGLIDGALQCDELVDEARRAGASSKPRTTRASIRRRSASRRSARFALIYGSGNVVSGRGRTRRPARRSSRRRPSARRSRRPPRSRLIGAIVFRIDSPGGSALASELVWRAAERARASGKPVVASFSDVAASGGYYVAAGADAIVASPGSITGSIGVFALRPVLAGVLDKLDIGYDSLTRAPARRAPALDAHALAGVARAAAARRSPIYDLLPRRAWTRAASSTATAVDEVGQGRVWTGAQAAEIGLVDTLGGLRSGGARGQAHASTSTRTPTSRSCRSRRRARSSSRWRTARGSRVGAPWSAAARAILARRHASRGSRRSSRVDRWRCSRILRSEIRLTASEKEFQVTRPRSEAVEIAARDETLLGLFPDTRTEIVRARGRAGPRAATTPRWDVRAPPPSTSASVPMATSTSRRSATATSGAS